MLKVNTDLYLQHIHEEGRRDHQSKQGDQNKDELLVRMIQGITTLLHRKKIEYINEND